MVKTIYHRGYISVCVCISKTFLIKLFHCCTKSVEKNKRFDIIVAFSKKSDYAESTFESYCKQ